MMNRRRQSDRSKETPMEYEYTSRPSTGQKPVWVQDPSVFQTPQKRTFADANPPTPIFPGTPITPVRPTFAPNCNSPFLFQQPLPHTPQTHIWAPPEPELKDVPMADASPGGPSPEKDKEGESERAVSMGALRRVYNKRHQRERSQVGRRRARVDDEEESSGEESGDERYAPVQKTTNHYTLNVAGPSAPPPDWSFRLLGFVQFFFNSSLALIALYILVQFILMIQRDVEHRVAEYSMDIVQEIAQCALAYKTNFCADNKVPAMISQCADWEVCMNRDPTKVGRAKITFEVFGEVLNTFVEQISFKTLIFAVVALSFFTVFINSVINLFRSRSSSSHIPPPHVPPYPIPPALSYTASQGYLPPAPGFEYKPWKSAEVDENPTRRRRLEDGQVAKVN